MSAKPKVTLCMITQNEENNIIACINSVKHLIDEIVIVDTGSTDSTIEQALQAQAKVYRFNWQHNFAEARNYGLEQADGDWILVLDADETLEPVASSNFSRLLNDPQVEGYFINIESYIGDGEEKIFDQAVRLFRNKPCYRFAGAIHEQVAGSIKANNNGSGLACADLKIVHRGYLKQAIQDKNKHQRNMEVINKALLANPDNPFLHYSLGIEYMQQGQITKGNQEFTTALAHMNGSEGYFQNLVMTLICGLLQTGQVQQANDFINKAAGTWPLECDVLLFKGIAALYAHDNVTAVQFLQQAINGITDNTVKSSIHSLCGDIYNILADCAKAEMEYFSALKFAPHQLYPLMQIIGLKQKDQSQLDWREISKFASPAINKSLRQNLVQMREMHLVLLLGMLNIMNFNTDTKDQQALLTVCNDYLQDLMLYQPVDELAEITLRYLHSSAELILLYARVINIHNPFLPIMPKLDSIIKADLDLIIKTLCPPCNPRLAFTI